jgi:four helix bundle protein
MRDFTKITAWQRAHALLLFIERGVADYPKAERFELASQTTRAARSVGANIAEGAGRRTASDFARFVRMAAGSCNEVENHLIVGRDLGFLSEDAWNSLASELRIVRAMLTRLAQTLERAPSTLSATS